MKLLRLSQKKITVELEDIKTTGRSSLVTKSSGYLTRKIENKNDKRAMKKIIGQGKNEKRLKKNEHWTAWNISIHFVALLDKYLGL